MTTFAEVRRRALCGSILGKNTFAEDVTLLLPNGQQQRTRALVGKSLRNLHEAQSELRSVEEIQVRLSRDPKEMFSGEALGGLERPVLGLGLVRDGDPEPRPFSFELILQQDAESWLLQFTRERTERVGTAQTQR